MMKQFSEHDLITIQVFRESEKNKCIICGNETKIRTSWVNQEEKKHWSNYFDLCESCKMVKNCFTCRYSKAHYLKYRGQCDCSWQELTLHRIVEQIENAEEEHNMDEYENSKKILWEFLARFGITKERLEQMKKEGKEMNIEDANKIILDKTSLEILEKRKDCAIFKHKKIGTTIKDFWQSKGCGRYQRGEPTKNEFDEYNCNE